MSAFLNEPERGNQLVTSMLSRALKKSKQGSGRSAVLMTIKPNGVDITSEFTHWDDLPAAIAECDRLKASMVEMLNSVERAHKRTSTEHEG